MVAAGCGSSSGNGSDLISQAQHSLAQIHSGTIAVRASAGSPVLFRRNATVQAAELPLSKVDLPAWTSNPRQVSCAEDLRCARADVDAQRVLQAFEPLLPSLPVNPNAIHDTTLEVALHGSVLRSLKLAGKVDTGFPFGDLPFRAELDFPAVPLAKGLVPARTIVFSLLAPYNSQGGEEGRANAVAAKVRDCR